MNLHGIVSPYIAAVNPMVLASIRVSVGSSAPSASGKRTPLYATPGSITASIAAGVLTVATVLSGVLRPGQTLAGAGVPPLTSIVSQISGAPGGVGQYLLDNLADGIATEAMTTSLVVPAQVQPMSSHDLRQVEGLNLNGYLKSIYLNGTVDGVVRVALKGGDLVDLPDGTTWLVVVNVEGFDLTAGWTKAVMVLQNGA